jgi:type IV pilus assembly protein PilW
MKTINFNREAGFSLVELLVAMTLGLIVLTGLSNTFLMQNRAYDMQDQIMVATQKARGAMDLLSRELRMAGYDPRGAGFDPLPVSTTQLRIRTDLNGDGQTTSTNENIIYAYDSSEMRITRNDGSGAFSLCRDVQTFVFEYLDENGNITAVNANVRAVRLRIVVRTEKPDSKYPSNGGYRTRSLEMVVTPPNLAI